MQVKKQQLELDMEQQTGSKLGKEYVKPIHCHPAYLTYMQSTSWGTSGLEETQAEIKIARRNIDNLRYANDTTLMAESEDKLKSLLMKVKEESEKDGLKRNIQNTNMVSGPITSWQIDGEAVETVTDYFLGAPKSLQMVIAAMKLKDAYSLEGKLWPTHTAYLKAETLLCQQRSV